MEEKKKYDGRNNLISFKDMDPELHKQISSKGGKACAAARKERKKLKEELLALLSDEDAQKRMCIALIKKAQEGDVNAYRAIEESIGEKQKQELSIENNVIEVSLVDDNEDKHS